MTSSCSGPSLGLADVGHGLQCLGLGDAQLVDLPVVVLCFVALGALKLTGSRKGRRLKLAELASRCQDRFGRNRRLEQNYCAGPHSYETCAPTGR